MKFIPRLWADHAAQKHDNNSNRLVSAPGANYYYGCQTSNVWRRNMSLSRESRPRGSRTQQTKITYAARARTLNRFKKIILRHSSLQCRRFLLARKLLPKAPCRNFPRRGGDGASQREREGGGEKEEKTVSLYCLFRFRQSFGIGAAGNVVCMGQKAG